MSDEEALDAGTMALDERTGRVGRVVEHPGPHVQLRSLGDGVEWNADPDHVRPVTPEDRLKVRLAETNARSRIAYGRNVP